MPIQSVKTDEAALTLTAIGAYPVPVERLWEAWADPRQLECFWGPPTWPATFTSHELKVGARTQYFMTGPNGESSHGFWQIQEVEVGRRFAVLDGFANPDGTPNETFPQTTMEFSFEKTAEGSRFIAVSTFASLEAMEQLVKMGMVEGLTEAMGQLDALLEDLRDHAIENRKRIPSTLPPLDTVLKYFASAVGWMKRVLPPGPATPMLT
jgi:uncharacterized protein YndB with AHSA1/START domain